jgi:hypothetical protein
MMERLKDILFNPVTAILKAKKERNLNKTLMIMILSWVMVGMGVFLEMYSMGLNVALVSSLAIFLFGILFSLFCSYIISIVMNILGGRGRYSDGLTATTYSSLPISLGILITALLSTINPFLGAIVGFMVIAVTAALTLSIYFRAIKELYSTDMLMVFIGFLIVLYVFLISVYLSIGFSIGSGLLSFLPMRIM